MPTRETEETSRGTRTGRINLVRRNIPAGTLEFSFEADATQIAPGKSIELVIEHSYDGDNFEWYLKVPSNEARPVCRALLAFEDSWWADHPDYWVRGYALITGSLETRIVSRSTDGERVRQ